MTFGISAKSIFAFLLLSLIAACPAITSIGSTKIEKPDIKYVDYRVGNPDRNKVTIYLNFNAHNSNKIGLKNIFISYELFTEGRRFLKGDEIELSLVPNGDTRIEVPAQVIYKDVLETLGPVAKEVLRGQKILPVTAKVTIFGKPTIYNETKEGTLFSFSFTTTKIVDVPIPQDKIDDFRNKAKDKLKGLF